MLRYINKIQKEDFLTYISEMGIKVEKEETTLRTTRCWKISDKFKNEWKIYVGEVDLFTIINKSYNGGFVLGMYMKTVPDGVQVELINAIEGKRKVKSDRFLKKYKELARMISSLYKFNYFR